MQPKLEKIRSVHTSSLTVKREISPYMDYPWHYHPEHEIIFVEKSYGIRLMGSHIGNFTDGDLMFISSNLPHVWKNDNDFYQNNKNLFVEVFVIHFNEDALGPGFFDLPECVHIKKLFVLGQQGVHIKGADHKIISGLIKETVATNGIERLALFLKTLETIAVTSEYELLSSAGYTNKANIADSERINLVTNYIMQNYANEISLEEVAKLSNLNTSSFCRYFKAKTHKTFSEFLNEVRILNACKMLVKNDMNVTEVCYQTGYNNISHFARQFKLLTNMTAKEYAKRFKQNLIK